MTATAFLADALTQFHVLRSLSEFHRERIQSEASTLNSKAGATLFTAGEMCCDLPLVVSGSVRLTRFAGDGARSILLYRITAGDICAQAALSALSESPVAASAHAETDSRLLLIPAALLRTLILAAPEFALFIHQRIAQRYVQILKLVEDVTFSRLEQRLATRLLGDLGPLRTTHQKLARDLGSAREVVSRLLKEFEQRDWITMGRGSVMITNPRALESLAARTASPLS